VLCRHCDPLYEFVAVLLTSYMLSSELSKLEEYLNEKWTGYSTLKKKEGKKVHFMVGSMKRLRRPIFISKNDFL